MTDEPRFVEVTDPKEHDAILRHVASGKDPEQTRADYDRATEAFWRKAKAWRVLHPDAKPEVEFHPPPEVLADHPELKGKKVGMIGDADELLDAGLGTANDDAMSLLRSIGAETPRSLWPTAFQLTAIVEEVAKLHPVRFYIVQVQCPERHRVVGAGFSTPDDDEAAAGIEATVVATFRRQAERFLLKCPVCKGPVAGFDVVPTPFHYPEDAKPFMERLHHEPTVDARVALKELAGGSP